MIDLSSRGALDRGFGAVGSALPWHGRGQGFESPKLHPLFSLVRQKRIGVISALCLVLTGRGGQIGGLACLLVRLEEVIHRLGAAS
jgi:hypothetical protein